MKICQKYIFEFFVVFLLQYFFFQNFIKNWIETKLVKDKANKTLGLVLFFQMTIITSYE